ncbi:MAG: hypothetical protein ACRDTA_08905 [Pseudonocardiaceae bacterium]
MSGPQATVRRLAEFEVRDVSAWGAVSPEAPRSLRGRPFQVKGAFGVANAMPLRGTLDLEASTAPSGQNYGQARGLPSTTRGTAGDPRDLERQDAWRIRRSPYQWWSEFAIMKVHPRKRQ